MGFHRASGILLHPTSLPGEHGIGDLGPEAYWFVDLLREAGQSYWQVLPLGPTGYGDSPYQSFSAFAGNTLLISLEELAREGFLLPDQLAEKPAFPTERVDFGSVYDWKPKILQLAFYGFQKNAGMAIRDEFERFRAENDWWLHDYALFRAIKTSQGQASWLEWPEPLRQRRPDELATVNDQLSDQVLAEKFFQFVFSRQWSSLKKYANDRGVRLIGDMPIFAALDSADVWCNQDRFKLNQNGTPKVVAGVPPDYFSETGQLWGNPVYDWERMRQDRFSWWIARVGSLLRTVDVIRIDHFRGFEATWEVPGNDETAENGSWEAVPGKELFSVLAEALPSLPVIAEDLGVITPEVIGLRDSFGFPGMKILQYAFGGDARNSDLPHNYVRNCVAYTGTHDNETAVGWWEAHSPEGVSDDDPGPTRVTEHCKRYLATDGSKINWDLMRAIWASVADTAIVPIQDVIGVGSEGRMNLPATETENWTWRMTKEAISPDVTQRLREMTETYGRLSPE